MVQGSKQFIINNPSRLCSSVRTSPPACLSPSHLIREPTDNTRWLVPSIVCKPSVCLPMRLDKSQVGWPSQAPQGLGTYLFPSSTPGPTKTNPSTGLRFENEGNEPISHAKTFRLETRWAPGSQSDPVFEVTARDDHEEGCEHFRSA